MRLEASFHGIQLPENPGLHADEKVDTDVSDKQKQAMDLSLKRAQEQKLKELINGPV